MFGIAMGRHIAVLLLFAVAFLFLDRDNPPLTPFPTDNYELMTRYEEIERELEIEGSGKTGQVMLAFQREYLDYIEKNGLEESREDTREVAVAKVDRAYSHFAKLVTFNDANSACERPDVAAYYRFEVEGYTFAEKTRAERCKTILKDQGLIALFPGAIFYDDAPLSFSLLQDEEGILTPIAAYAFCENNKRRSQIIRLTGTSYKCQKQKNSYRLR